MKLSTTRFGEIDIADDTLIHLPGGMVGFPDETQFAWVPHPGSSEIAWLQSARSPAVAFPLLNAAQISDEYPDVPLPSIAEQGGITYDSEDALALLVVLCASESAALTVNLMAPVVINAETRRGAQVIMNGTRFSTATLGTKESAGASP